MILKFRFNTFVLTLFAVLLCSVALSACSSQTSSRTLPRQDDTAVIAQAFANRQSDIFVTASGPVEKILLDDLVGSRHQRFIARLSNGQTLLIAHNIDIAPRIDDLQVDDYVMFHGKYEWNDKGGFVHWTHRDPTGHRAGGWIEHKGRRYQ